MRLKKREPWPEATLGLNVSCTQPPALLPTFNDEEVISSGKVFPRQNRPAGEAANGVFLAYDCLPGHSFQNIGAGRAERTGVELSSKATAKTLEAGASTTLALPSV